MLAGAMGGGGHGNRDYQFYVLGEISCDAPYDFHHIVGVDLDWGASTAGCAAGDSCGVGGLPSSSTITVNCSLPREPE